jgi:outer membrane immunogenic protein
LQAGFNHQSGSFVYGVEADVSLAGITGETADEGGNDVIRADVNVLASLRARLGVASQQFLAYATGGVAYAGGLYTLTDDLGDGGENTGTAKLSSIGGVVGGGAEVAIGQRTSLRLEGLYYIFGTNVDTSTLTDDSDDGDFLGLKSICVIRAGINFRL